MLNRHPVNFSVQTPETYAPLQLVFRIATFFLLGMFGLSFGLVFLVVYGALPLYVAARLQGEGELQFKETDEPRLLRGLAWFTAVYSWMGLVVDRLPSQSPSETIQLTIQPSPPLPTPSAALWRIVSGLPSLAVLCLMNLVGLFVWLYAAFTILVQQSVGAGAHRFLLGLQRFAVRLLAYEAGLCHELPRFEFAEPTLSAAP